MAGKRKYEQRRRAESRARTRQRITEAAVELHGSLGPARTTVTAVAERAGVQRVTVYDHFPDEAALFAACSRHYDERHPPPRPAAWAGVADPETRLRAALDALFAYYAETEAMTANVLRDAELVPALRGPVDEWLGYLAAVRDGLAAGWGARGAASRRLRAALDVALSFETWRTLVRHAGLKPGEAVELLARSVRAQAATRR